MNPKDLFDLQGKTAVITGAAQGLGRQICLALSRAGASVVIGDIKYPEKTLGMVEQTGGSCTAVQVDVTEEDQVKHLAEQAATAYGKVDILVNNAGISQLDFTPTPQLSADLWDRVINTNLKGTFLCCKHIARFMIENRRGSIVNIASTAAFTGISRAPAYCASKAGVVALTRSLAVEWAKKNIRVNAVAPHYLETELTKGIRDTEKVYDAVVKQIPMGRLGKPSDIVGAVIYLASDAAQWTTGSVIPADGGFLSS